MKKSILILSIFILSPNLFASAFRTLKKMTDGLVDVRANCTLIYSNKETEEKFTEQFQNYALEITKTDDRVLFILPINLAQLSKTFTIELPSRIFIPFFPLFYSKTNRELQDGTVLTYSMTALESGDNFAVANMIDHIVDLQLLAKINIDNKKLFLKLRDNQIVGLRFQALYREHYGPAAADANTYLKLNCGEEVPAWFTYPTIFW